MIGIFILKTHSIDACRLLLRIDLDGNDSRRLVLPVDVSDVSGIIYESELTLDLKGEIIERHSLLKSTDLVQSWDQHKKYVIISSFYVGVGYLVHPVC